MKRLLIILIMLQVFPSFGQSKLSMQAKKLQYYYDQLQKQPHSPVLQVQYIQEFPADQFNFIELFNSHTGDELTGKGTDYVKFFRKLGNDYPDSVLPKAIAIGKEMPTWSAGPEDELQKAIYYITDKHPQMFVDMVKELKKSEQESLAKFLYAGPEGKNVNYDILVDIFDRAGERKIKKIFAETKPTDTEE